MAYEKKVYLSEGLYYAQREDGQWFMKSPWNRSPAKKWTKCEAFNPIGAREVRKSPRLPSDSDLLQSKANELRKELEKVSEQMAKNAEQMEMAI